MTPEQFGGLLGAIGTFFVGLYGAYRLAKADRYKASSDSAALLLAGWKNLQEAVSEEVERVKKSCAEQIALLRDENEKDRKEWAQERGTLREEVASLKAEVFSLMQLTTRSSTARTRRNEAKET